MCGWNELDRLLTHRVTGVIIRTYCDPGGLRYYWNKAFQGDVLLQLPKVLRETLPPTGWFGEYSDGLRASTVPDGGGWRQELVGEVDLV